MSNNGPPVDFPGNNPTFKFKQKLTGLTGNDGTKAVQIMVPLEYLINFWRTLEMLLTNCETNFTQNWAANCVISNAVHNQAIILAITDTKLYVPVVTLLTQDNGKLLQQLKLGYNYTINRNKYHSKAEPLNAPNSYLDFLIFLSFPGVNILFVLLFTKTLDILFSNCKSKRL